MTSHNFDTYDVPSEFFNIDTLHKQYIRLNGASFSDEYARLTQCDCTRRFIARTLTVEEVGEINRVETMKSAQDAERFRDSLLKIEVREGYEPLVDLRGIAGGENLMWTFSQIPYHAACGEWAGKERLMWVREGLAERLASLTRELLECDFSLHFEDAFRPTGVQEGLFTRRYEMAQNAQPTWTHEQCLLEAQSKTAFTPRFAAHKAGAAVDVRVRDLRTQELLDIGHSYPDGGEIVRLETEFVTQAQWQNRKILQAVARRAGLAMYPFEDWHLCMNDVTAAVVNDDEHVVTYGPVKSFNYSTGAITHAYDEHELDEAFGV